MWIFISSNVLLLKPFFHFGELGSGWYVLAPLLNRFVKISISFVINVSIDSEAWVSSHGWLAHGVWEEWLRWILVESISRLKKCRDDSLHCIVVLTSYCLGRGQLFAMWFDIQLEQTSLLFKRLLFYCCRRLPFIHRWVLKNLERRDLFHGKERKKKGQDLSRRRDIRKS